MSNKMIKIILEIKLFANENTEIQYLNEEFSKQSSFYEDALENVLNAISYLAQEVKSFKVNIEGGE